MIELIRVHRPDYGQLIRDLRQLGQCVGHPNAALAKLLEFARCAKQCGCGVSEGESLPLKVLVGARLPVSLDQFWLVIEQIEVRWRAGHVQKDHVLGAPIEMWRSRREGRSCLLLAR